MKKPYISYGLILLTIIFVFLGNIFYTVSPHQLGIHSILAPPSWSNPFGTDRLGRDILARVIEGGKNSIIIGVGSAVIGNLIGLMVGITAGFFRGTVDKVTVVVIDLFLTFPTFFLLLALISYIDASAFVLIVVISITGWMGTSRMIRSESFAIGSKGFIKILRVAKVSTLKIIFKYYTPLLAPILLVSFTFGVSGAILSESGLSFLGLGITPPDMSWGSILADGKSVIDIAWWVSFFPGLFIFIITLSLVQISDYLQNVFNQKEIAV